MEVINEKIIYEDVVGKISGKQNKHGGSVTLFDNHKYGLHEEISVPNAALEGIVFYLNKARGL